MKNKSTGFVVVTVSFAALLSISFAQSPPYASSTNPLNSTSPAIPLITGAKVFGVRPGHPFLFTVSATGDRPMKFSAENLPAGLTLDPITGRITGFITDKGESDVTLHAENSLGQTQRKLHLVCGDMIALTPPMGWNSWNCFGWKVTDQEVRSAADAMVSSGLINHGWTYINIDDCWEGNRDANGVIQSNAKFPDMKALSDYIHSKGLKFGIYSSPGVITCGHSTGSYQHEDQDAQRYAEWGVDYVKYDWCSYGKVWKTLVSQECEALLPADAPRIQDLLKQKADLEAIPRGTKEIADQLQKVNWQLDGFIKKLSSEDRQRISLENWEKPYRVFRSSLDKVPRDMVFSLCQYGMGNVWEWGQDVGGNCWRTKGDITDTWESMSGIGFKQVGYEKYAGPGHWNDPDMLTVGTVGWGGSPHPTRLTPNEQYTHISMWCLSAAPLLIGCDMSRLDAFTYGLLSNDEVLAIDQDPLGKQAVRISQVDSGQVYAKDLEDGSKAVGLFNLGPTEAQVTVNWQELGLIGKQVVHDLWRKSELGIYDNKFQATVPSHGVVFVRVYPDLK